MKSGVRIGRWHPAMIILSPHSADRSNHWPVSCPRACRPAGPWCSAKHQNVCKSWTGRRPAVPGDEKKKNHHSICSSGSKQSKTPWLFHYFLKTTMALVSEGKNVYTWAFLYWYFWDNCAGLLSTYSLCNCLPLRFQGVSHSTTNTGWQAHQFLVCVCVCAHAYCK